MFIIHKCLNVRVANKCVSTIDIKKKYHKCIPNIFLTSIPTFCGMKKLRKLTLATN